MGDVEIETVEYRIAGDGFEKSGSIPVGAVDGEMFDARIGGIPVGGPYTLTLSARATGGSSQAVCTGSVTFSIASAGEIASATVVLNCAGSRQRGSVDVNGQLNFCPVVDSISVLPTTTSVGGVVQLEAETSDAEDDAVTFEWTTSNGSVDNPSARDTTYTCPAVGSKTVTLTVRDGNCESDALSVTIT